MGNPQVLPLNEAWHAGGFVVSEARGHLSRAQIPLSPGAVYRPGAVLGQITVGAATGSAVTGAGNGTLTLNSAAPVGANVQVGTYTLTCTQASTGTPAAAGYSRSGNVGNATIGAVTPGSAAVLGLYQVLFTAPTAFSVHNPAGQPIGTGNTGAAFDSGGLSFIITAGATAGVAGDGFEIKVTDDGAALFSVTSPNGQALPNATVGSAYNSNHIQFTIAQGETKFAVGDGFTVTVAAGSGAYTLYDPTAVTGAQVAAGILYSPVDATTRPRQGTAIVRTAEVNASELVWGAAVTNRAHVTAALTQLATAQVIARPGTIQSGP
jgi:hypothetical protein